ncbi:MAG TPA: porphobilinogen synthase [Leptospiraceae bacterium]|nr:porphobilinogen synthase [Leptospiraceae bacterium]HMW07273.1 porphobilinogen synthase [Leptospiraceae bacterium]HMX33712.1 porphobilinogen synthase [Leptospiraceae bacterium]HMY32909.1 porphobilinogen synthase [Leptospiraceae bacterium]HNA09007.1 porphobilinogen synthase [Leptospiraceae bacterium]
MNILRRPRRNRKSSSIREMISETNLNVSKLIHPIFLQDGLKQKTEIKSMPDFYRYSSDLALKDIEESLLLGIHHFILFPQIEEKLKDSKASLSYKKNNLYLKFIQSIKKNFPEVTVITDVAMDPYSSDGHDGYVENGKILNDETLLILGKMALAQAEAGADILGPSDMMDGRVGYLRNILDKEGFKDVSIMSYTAKYASSFYGPFRDALNSAPKAGDKKTYQMDSRNSREALLEAELDYEEGADFLMVKPALAYLDIIQTLKNNFPIPIVAYNVSGEYAMIKAAAKQGWLDESKAMIECLTSIQRAGADIIITYFAKDFAKLQQK